MNIIPDQERVHFYSENDLSMSSYLDRLECVFDSYKPGKTYDNIGDVIELWHCKKFIKSHKFERWDDKKYNRYKKVAKECTTDIVYFFQNLDTKKFLPAFETLDQDYQRCIFEIFDKIVRNFLTEDILRAILSKFPHFIREVLQKQNIVTRWAIFITEFLKEYDLTAELLLMQFAEKHEQEKDLIFPRTFSLSDRESCISNYCDSENANLNYVRLIQTYKDCEDLKLTPRTRLKAKRTAEKLNAEIFLNKDNSLIMSMQIRYSVEDKEYKYDLPIITECKDINDNPCLITHINRNYLIACNNAEIIYNFYIFFEWFNEQGYSTLVSNPNNLSIFESIGIQARNAYPIGMTFQYFNNLAVSQLITTQQILNTEGRSLEDTIKDFYENHLKKSYDYPAPNITIPTQNIDYVTKLRILMPEMDAIVKHYDSFVENGFIDLELIALSKPLSITKGRSRLKNRNIYATSDRSCAIHGICHLLFSEQSVLAYVKQYNNERYETLFETMKHKKVNYDLLYQHQQRAVDFLIEQNTITLDNEKHLCFSNMNQLFIYFLLWKYQVISYWHCTKNVRDEIDKMKKEGWVESDNFLLSKQEQDWFSYYLNNAKFTNGPAIRNIFEHGANTLYTEGQKRTMYYYIQMLFITLLYKIDLDLRLATVIEKKII